ncbi:MAG: site-specific DNA-methyltransferase, partial [Firmicutes bacterium]|nr:site-specific DNA-methyltransferase [Bacillota bacterium]
MNESKLTGQSLDIVAENVQKLKSLFPEIVTEDKIDFEKLQAVLGEYIDNDNERYNFTWYGKSKALRLAQTQSTGTLRPCKEESKDWDNTQNLYIEGDNLEVLKLLQKAYHNKIKMIYIDPPYNTGKDFVYSDDYKDNLENYLKVTGQKAEDGGKFSTNSESNGRYHTNWLNMMYPRLRLARNLLRDDGVVFISIDDKEVSNLIKICNEIFGEENFIACIAVVNNMKGRSDDKFIATAHESLLMYQKLAFETFGVEIPDE